MNLTVAKFGGTSMGTAQSLREVADIIRTHQGSLTVVVSATSGTTDALLRLGEEAGNGRPWEEGLNQLMERHQGLIKELGLSLDLGTFQQDLFTLLSALSTSLNLTPAALDHLASFGERISSTLLAHFLQDSGQPAEAVDAYELISTDDHFGEGKVDFARSNERMLARLIPLLERGVVPVISGFIGQSESGHYITLGRGGSDYTGAIVAGALDAKLLEIWTDVDGIFEADPRLIPQATFLEALSFNEASEVAYFGAKVLHPKTIKPALSKNIPVKILNTFNRKAVGTLITNEESPSLKSVTFKKGITILNICSAQSLEAHGFLGRVFELFAKYEIVIDVIATSEVSVSLTLDKGVDCKQVLEELQELGQVEVTEDMAIVCLVGSEIRHNPKILGRLFSALTEHVISMVSLGASKRNITFLVPENEAKEVVKKVFDTFFTN